MKILGFYISISKKKPIEEILDEYHNWASSKFPNSTAKSSIEGLKREIIELEEEIEFNYGDVYMSSKKVEFEYVDCLMYILDSSRRYGISNEILWQAFNEKLEINKNRNWKINEDKSYSHIKK